MFRVGLREGEGRGERGKRREREGEGRGGFVTKRANNLYS